MRKSFSLAFFFFLLYFPGTKHNLIITCLLLTTIGLFDNFYQTNIFLEYNLQHKSFSLGLKMFM